MEGDPQEQREPTIRTMKTDAQEVIKKDNISFLDIYAKEAAKSPYLEAPSRSSKKYVYVLIAVLLVAIGASTYYVLAIRKNEPPPKPALEIPRSFIPVSQSATIEVRPNDRTGLINALEKARSSAPEKEFTYIPVAVGVNGLSRLAYPSEFFGMLEADPPGDFLDGITGRWNIYMYSGDAVLLFEIKDEIKVRGALLRWDETIAQRLRAIMKKFEPTAYTFEDIREKNIDIRIARLSTVNDAAVGYAIVLGKFLVIATSEVSLRATIARLVAGPVIL